MSKTDNDGEGFPRWPQVILLAFITGGVCTDVSGVNYKFFPQQPSSAPPALGLFWEEFHCGMSRGDPYGKDS